MASILKKKTPPVVLIVFFFTIVFFLIALYNFLPSVHFQNQISKPIEIAQIVSVSSRAQIAINNRPLKLTKKDLPFSINNNDRIKTKKFSKVSVQIFNGDSFLLEPVSDILLELHNDDDLGSPVYLFLNGGQITKDERLVPAKATDANTYVVHQGKISSFKSFSPTPIENNNIKAPPQMKKAKNSQKIKLGTTNLKPLKDQSKLPLHKAVENLIASRRDKVEHCFLNRIKEIGQAQGSILFGMTLNPDGHISQVKPLKSQITDEKMISCISSVIRRLSTPLFEGKPIYYSYTVSFE